jgi:predicted RNA-binding Zn-ribbon protein involved in translation (DUF1610 family)
MLRFACPRCGTTITAIDEAVGGTSTCRACGERVRIPSASNPLDSSVRTSITAPAEVYLDPSPAENPVPHLILCYTCKKEVAYDAFSCPHCGAVQTREGREKGKRLKREREVHAAIAIGGTCSLFLICCLGVFTGGGSNTSNFQDVPSVPPAWDMDELQRDTDEVARDPTDSKTILIPYDGSQPVVVPNPDSP